MKSIELTSPDFQPGGAIPGRFTCKGEDVSPALHWGSLPEEARSLALIFDDPDAPSGMFSHWVLYNISTEMDGLPVNYTPAPPAQSGRNDFGQIGYGGPCPPAGENHRYYFRLYALDEDVALTSGATRAQLLDAMQGHIIAQTELIGTFGGEQ